MDAKVLAIVLGIGLASVAGARGATLPGTWQRLPSAPDAAAIPYGRVGVWTGRRLIVVGRAGTPGAMRNVAFAYTPAIRRWRALSPPPGPTGSYEGALATVWTGPSSGPPRTWSTPRRRTAGARSRRARRPWEVPPPACSSGP